MLTKYMKLSIDKSQTITNYMVLLLMNGKGSGVSVWACHMNSKL